MLSRIHIRAGAGKTVFLTLLWAVIIAGSAHAQSTWPADNMYVGYTYANASAVQDPNDIPNNQIEFDLIYDPSIAPYTVQIAVVSSTVFFRLQVRNIQSWTVGTYLIFVANTSGTILGKTYLTLTGNAGSIHILNATGTIDLTTGSGSHNTNIGGWARFGSITNTSYEYVDFQIPQSSFESTLGISASSGIKFYAGTSTGGGNINNINTDWMTPSANGAPTATDFSTLSLATLFSINFGALPVELSSFTAQVNKGATQLRWRTATELNNFGFEVQRSAGGRDWETIGFVPGYGTVFSPQSYNFEDAILPRGMALRYRLRQIDRDGSFEYSPVVEVQPEQRLMQGIVGSFPTPATSVATINYIIEHPGSVLLTMHDMTGRLVRTVSEQTHDTGSHSVMLGVSDLPRGMYMLRLQQSEYVHIQPLLVMD